MPTLTIQLPGLPSVEHIVREDAITLGRMKGNSIALNESSVSLSHAKITRIGNDFFLKDLNSTNGTMLNGQSITEARLRDGDQLKFGEVTAYFRLEPLNAPAPVVAPAPAPVPPPPVVPPPPAPVALVPPPAVIPAPVVAAPISAPAPMPAPAPVPIPIPVRADPPPPKPPAPVVVATVPAPAPIPAPAPVPISIPVRANSPPAPKPPAPIAMAPVPAPAPIPAGSNPIPAPKPTTQSVPAPVSPIAPSAAVPAATAQTVPAATPATAPPLRPYAPLPTKPRRKSLRLPLLVGGGLVGIAVLAALVFLAWNFFAAAPAPEPRATPSAPAAVAPKAVPPKNVAVVKTVPPPVLPAFPAPVDVAGASAPDKNLADLMKGLKSPDVTVRRQAASAIYNLGPAAEDALPILPGVLADADPEVRMWAALALVHNNVQERATIPILVQTLQHDNPTLRQVACLSLAMITYTDEEKATVIPALVDIATKDANPDVANDAQTALKIIAPDLVIGK